MKTETPCIREFLYFINNLKTEACHLNVNLMLTKGLFFVKYMYLYFVKRLLKNLKSQIK